MDIWFKIIASIVTALLLCCGTYKALGAMQQSGYKNGVFLRWLRRKDNLYFNRVAVFALCLALATTVVSLCFSFLGVQSALLVSSIPFFGLCFVLVWADDKYALKVPFSRTGRANRLFVAYLILTAVSAYGLIELLAYLAKINGSFLYGLIAYAPFVLVVLLLPLLLCLSNAILSVFENARNKKFIKRAYQVLDETKITRIAIVGSYGKTSIKNILKTLLLEKFTVVETPQSYNTPIGVAKTVFSDQFASKQIFLAEMGAKHKGDIAELCKIVKPDYAIFTGVCAQHIQTFGSLQKVWEAKSEILQSTAKTIVCGEGLKTYLPNADERIIFAEKIKIQNLRLFPTQTTFSLCIGEEVIQATTPLLGEMAAENILQAAILCQQLGMTAEEIARGIEKLSPVPHRLQLLESNGVYILDDGYNANTEGAKQAIAALARFSGKKCIVTPGIVECGVLQEDVNGALGEEIARAHLDKVILVGETLVGAVKAGYDRANGDEGALCVVKTLEEAKVILADWVQTGDAILFLNDLPDVY